MAQVEVLLPKMGESVAEATIIKWLKKEGDKIEAEEAIVEIATDKVDSEVPSPSAGILSKIVKNDGEVAKVGEIIAVIADSKTEEVKPNTPTTSVTGNGLTSNGKHSEQAVQYNSPKINSPVAAQSLPKSSPGGRFLSPLVRNIAKKEGVTVQELDAITGSGKDGRVTKKDILSYLPGRNKSGKQEQFAPIKPVIPEQPATTVKKEASYNTASTGDNVEIIEMDRMRKLIADHMVHSKHTSPHVTSFVEADVTNMVLWREKIKKKFEEREKEKLTFTPLFVEAVVKALKDFPMVNVSVDGTKIIKKKNINIGMATALPSGNLIVPVIRNADRMNLLGLTQTVNDLAGRARINKLQPDEIQGGTFTISNVGTFGNLMGTPIINQPQVAILATGSIKKKPAVIETPFGDTIGIRHMMFLSLSYDHRVVDGALGGSFLRKIADYLEQFDINREI
jgi:2-oxoglutarate dehydrogenase E2 component (dihydrolipoamide succinyltransferase)